MKIMPYEVYEKKAHKNQRVCVTAELPGDTETPITLYQKLQQPGGTFLLESVADGVRRGRYSFIGNNPEKRLTSYGLKWKVQYRDGHVEEGEGKILDHLKEMLGEAIPSPMEEGPDFIGGAVGTMGYDLIRQYEDLGETGTDDRQLPDADFFIMNQLVAFDHARQAILLMVVTETEGSLFRNYGEAVQKLKQLAENIRQPVAEKVEDHHNQNNSGKISSTETEDSFTEKVLKAKEYIRNGDIFQVVLSQRYCVQPSPPPFETYRKLRTLNPSPYLFYFDFDDYQLMGASPEMLVKCIKGSIETCPIAGTRPRGKTPEEDEALAKEMASDEKEKAEHLMLVDLARNDVGKVSEFGSVTVDPFMVVKKFSHVMHLVTEVQGKLRNDTNAFDALASCLPAGTLSGAPKIRAMEIIDELEPVKRGPYGGAVGYFSYNGHMDTCITIRSVLFQNDIAYVQAGAGIVEDSQPEAEYQESYRKAQGMLQVLMDEKEREEKAQ